MTSLSELSVADMDTKTPTTSQSPSVGTSTDPPLGSLLLDSTLGDTECYAAGNTAMEEMDAAVEIVLSLELMLTVPFASTDMFPLAQSLAIGTMTRPTGRNPSGSLPIVALPHDELIATLAKRQLTITMPAVLK